MPTTEKYSWTYLLKRLPFVFAGVHLVCVVTFDLYLMPRGLKSSNMNYYGLYGDSIREGRLWEKEVEHGSECGLDKSFYKGRCYFYFGIFPALVHAAMPIMSDRFASAIISAVVIFFLTYLCVLVASKVSPHRGADPLSVLPLGLFCTLNTGVLTSALCGWVYAEAILFSLALGLAGIVLLFDILCVGAGIRVSPGRVIGGVALVCLAALSRASWFVVLILVTALSVWQLLKLRVERKHPILWSIVLLVCLTFLIQGVLNQVRFDSAFDFGLYKTRKQINIAEAGFSLVPVFRNILLYFFAGFPPFVVWSSPSGGTPNLGVLKFMTPLIPTDKPFFEWPTALFVTMPSLLLSGFLVRGIGKKQWSILGRVALVLFPLCAVTLLNGGVSWRYNIEAWLFLVVVMIGVLAAYSKEAPFWQVWIHWLSLAFGSVVSILLGAIIIFSRLSQL